jgi:hypothetical protein
LRPVKAASTPETDLKASYYSKCHVTAITAIARCNSQDQSKMQYSINQKSAPLIFLKYVKEQPAHLRTASFGFKITIRSQNLVPNVQMMPSQST